MPVWLIKLVLPVAFEAIKQYIKSSDSHKDDEVLEVVKKGVEYLACKDNNTLNYGHNAVIQNAQMIESEEL